MPGTSFDIIELYIVIQLNAILQATADVTPQLNQAIIILLLVYIVMSLQTTLIFNLSFMKIGCVQSHRPSTRCLTFGTAVCRCIPIYTNRGSFAIGHIRLG